MAGHMLLKGKKLVVTGAATGIGSATALVCAAEGAQVVVADINTADGERTVARARENGGSAWFVRADVSREAEVAALMQAAEERMGGINALVTAAGIARDSLVPIDEVQLREWERTISINLTGTFLAARHAVPAMRRAGKGVIVMIASGAGVRGPSSIVAYGASKGGVNGLAMTLESHLEKDNIRVNALCPGNIATPLKLGIIEQQVERIGAAANREGQMAGLGTPEGVARVIAFLLSDYADYVRGAVFTR